jgi:hypothetical protein
MSTIKLGESTWRFLAAAMLSAVCWAVWVIYQLNPQSPLILNPAFEAAAKARVNDIHGEKQNAQGVIALPAGAGGPAKSGDEPPKAADAVPATGTPAGAAPPAAEAAKVPPINPEKLKFSDTIAIPADPNAKK